MDASLLSFNRGGGNVPSSDYLAALSANKERVNMTSSRKLNMAIRRAKVFKGSNTLNAILSQVPGDVIRDCPARIIAQVMEAINAAYHDGRASTGAEVIDGEAIWISKHMRLYELEDLRNLPVSHSKPPVVQYVEMKK